MARKKQVMDPTLPRVQSDGNIIIPVTPMKTLGDNAKILMGNYSNKLDLATKEVFNSFIDVESIQKAGQGVSIPYMSTLFGNFIINPSSVSISTFQDMWNTDDTIRRCYRLNVATIVAGMGEYYHTDEKIQHLIRHAFKVVKGGKEGLIKQILSAMWAGFWVGIIEDYKDNDGYTFIKNVRQLPQISIQFTVTPLGDIENIWQYVYNYPYAGTQGALSTGFFNINDPSFFGDGGINQQSSLGDMDYPFRTNFINTFGLVQLDKKKTMYFGFDDLNGQINLYGYSPLRSIYDIWLTKAVTRRLYTSAMNRCANPMIVGYADGTKVANLPGGMDINSVDVLYNVLQAYTQESAIILPGLKEQMFDIQIVQNMGNFEVYDTASKAQDAAMEKACGLPEGLFSSTASYAGATAQNSIYTRLMDGEKNKVAHCILNYFVKHLIHENFGENIEDLGHFAGNLQNIDDKAKYEKIVEGMTNSGYLSNVSEVDIQRVRRTMGEPELEPKDLKELIKINKERDTKKPNDNTNRSHVKSTDDHYKNRSAGTNG